MRLLVTQLVVNGRVLRALGFGKIVTVGFRNGSVGVFANDSGISMTRKVTNYLNLPLNGDSYARFSSNRVSISLRRSIHNDSYFVIRSAYTPIGSGLVRVLVVVSTVGHTSTTEVAIIVPCFNCTERSEGTGTESPVSTGLYTSVVAYTNTSHILAVSLRTGRVRNFFGVPISRLRNTSLLTGRVERGVNNGGSSCVIMSPSLNSMAHSEGFTSGVNANLTVVSGEEPGTGIYRIVGVVNSTGNGGIVLISSVVSATNALYGTTGTVIRGNNTARICTYTARTILSNPTVREVRGDTVGRIILLSAVPIPGRGVVSGFAVLPITPAFTRTVTEVCGSGPFATTFN